MQYVEEIGAILGTLVAVSALAIKTHTFISNRLSNRIKEYEIYKIVRELLERGESKENLAAMQVALSCIISRELTLNEIRWFIYTPYAFKHLRDYSTQARYLEVSENQSGFCFKGEYTTRRTRLLESFQLAICYGLFGVGSAVILIYGQLFELPLPFLIIFYGFGVALGALAFAMLRQGIALSDTSRMIERVVITNTLEHELEFVDSLENKSA